MNYYLKIKAIRMIREFYIVFLTCWTPIQLYNLSQIFIDTIDQYVFHKA